MIALAVFLLLIWLANVAMALHRLRTIPRLDPSEEGSGAKEIISVIVPARDEERDIQAALRSILVQEGVDLEVIAVNDHSADDTGAILDRMAAADPRLRVVHDPILAEGWLGKANAMRAGLDLAAGEYVLFTDADVVHHPRCFLTALRELRHCRLDLVSALPHLQVRLFWEHAMLPMFISGMAKLVPEKRQMDPGRPDAVASGALILVQREVLDKVGGLAAVKEDMADDVALARVVKRAGFRAGYRLAPQLMTLELFKSNREAFSGTTKNILLVIEESIWLAPVLPFFTFMLFGYPLFLVGLGLGRHDLLLAAVGMGVYLVQYASLFITRGQFSFHPLPALMFPLAMVIVSWCGLRAFFLRRRGKITWRGRTLRVR